MVAIQDTYYMTPEEYFIWEEQQPIKYEYIDGLVFAMTGGTIPHNEITINLATLIKNHLRGKKCKVLGTDAKVGISEAGPFHYPDVMVSCDERDRQAIKVIEHPCLIIEVLSPSTEAFDRGKKFQNYRQIPSLKEYVLVSAEQMMIECFRLNAHGIWELYTYTQGEELELNSINLRCVVDSIYEDVILISSEETKE
ncbi:Uma2 family endonuclease [Chroococcus sp. FPU101]|uniref:Uma2 family endonuclease n=1 Tax=Chroococcus sp. FPU101 TaxID=1974212 RepID=UPI001A8EB886|nr:Uma2 family endonuclease [Chroococcus sp. FPU101]GFE67813.1 hypothetical protein CFPU101_04230 [Chroococcus sp. FPU101]